MTKHTFIKTAEFLLKYFRRRGIPHAEAEELVQEVFAIAFEKRLPSLQTDWVRASLTQIAKFEVLKWRRSRERRDRALARLSSSSIDASTFSRCEPQIHARILLERSFRELSAYEQTTLLEAALEPNVSDLSRALGVNYSRLHRLLTRARSRLAQL